MKRYTTRFLKSLALIYMAYPVTYLGTTAVLFDIPLAHCLHIILNPGYYLVCASAIIAGYGLWEMKRWSWYAFLIANVLTAYYTALIASDHAQSNYRAAAFVISIIALVTLVFRVAREIRVPYFLPRILWWESNPRYRLSVPVTLRRSPELPEVHGEILDLSMGGCFIKLHDDFLEDEKIAAQFKIFGIEVAITGTIVWRTQSAVTHPKGVGVKFAPFTRSQKPIFRAINARLKQIATLYRTSRYLMNQEDFFKKMNELQSAQIELRHRARKSS